MPRGQYRQVNYVVDVRAIITVWCVDTSGGVEAGGFEGRDAEEVYTYE